MCGYTRRMPSLWISVLSYSCHIVLGLALIFTVMPKAHPHTSDLSSLRRTALNTYGTIIAPSASIPNFTHTLNTRLNRGTPVPFDIRPVRVSNRSQPYHGAPDRSTHSYSPMISRTLSSGHLLHYLRDASLTDQTVEELRSRLVGPLGFDIEYRPNFVKGRPQNRTALVQLASDSVVLLVQVSAMSSQYCSPDMSRSSPTFLSI